MEQTVEIIGQLRRLNTRVTIILSQGSIQIYEGVKEKHMSQLSIRDI